MRKILLILFILFSNEIISQSNENFYDDASYCFGTSDYFFIKNNFVYVLSYDNSNYEYIKSKQSCLNIGEKITRNAYLYKRDTNRFINFHFNNYLNRFTYEDNADEINRYLKTGCIGKACKAIILTDTIKNRYLGNNKNVYQNIVTNFDCYGGDPKNINSFGFKYIPSKLPNDYVFFFIERHDIISNQDNYFTEIIIFKPINNYDFDCYIFRTMSTDFLKNVYKITISDNYNKEDRKIKIITNKSYIEFELKEEYVNWYSDNTILIKIK